MLPKDKVSIQAQSPGRWLLPLVDGGAADDALGRLAVGVAEQRYTDSTNGRYHQRS